MADITKVEQLDDPRRCQAVTARGQCMNVSCDNSKYCIAHGGNKAGQAMIQQSLRNYRLTKFNVRLQEMVEAPNIKSLRDEIAILRILMEERLNQCVDTKDLIYQSGPISDLVMKIDKVVLSCHKLESAMGALLDKQAIIQFGSELISIIGECIQDEEKLTHISNRIIETVARTLGEDSLARDDS